MASAPPLLRRPRGRYNKLHHAVEYGSEEHTLALLSSGSIDIDQQDTMSYTPLMIAAWRGRSRHARMLLDKGASVYCTEDKHYTALHLSAQEGHLAVSKMLIEAGANLEAKNSPEGATPLQMAAADNHPEVMGALIDAGADPNSRQVSGATPLFMAAQGGHINAVKHLLRAKADPLLPRTTNPGSGRTAVPLDVAAGLGYSHVVREMIQEVGIEGCGGTSGGVDALCRAAQNQHVDIMAMLNNFGVVDTGLSLVAAVDDGREASVKFLLQQQQGLERSFFRLYVNARDGLGRTILFRAISGLPGPSSPTSPRVVRLFVEAGTDTASVIRATDDGGRLVFFGTPLTLVTRMLHDKKVRGKDATKEQLHRLEGTRRLLLRVEAVHAVSLLWPCDKPSIDQPKEGTANNMKKNISTPVTTSVLPILRRRATRPRVLLAALFRNSNKP